MIEIIVTMCTWILGQIPAIYRSTCKPFFSWTTTGFQIQKQQKISFINKLQIDIFNIYRLNKVEVEIKKKIGYINFNFKYPTALNLYMYVNFISTLQIVDIFLSINLRQVEIDSNIIFFYHVCIQVSDFTKNFIVSSFI